MAVSRNLRVRGMAACFLLAGALFNGASSGQTQAPLQAPPAEPLPADKNSPEMATRDATPTFTTRSNLVVLRVVVRDKQGKVDGSLQKEDFQLFDKGKPQVISKFSVEKSAGRTVQAPVPESAGEKAPGEPAAPPPPPMPDRYVAYVVDNMHLKFEDLAQILKAADRHLAESMTPTTRAAIFTTSGQPMLDFTDDLAKLRDTLLRIRPEGILRGSAADCPRLSYYWADLIADKNDTQALNAAAQEALVCANMDPATMMSAAVGMARSTALQVVSTGETDTRLTLRLLNDVVRRTSAMPGQRTIILASPGFMVMNNQRPDESEVLDRAIRSNVIISTLDARGLYALVPGGDASERGGSLASLNQRTQYQQAGATLEGEVLGELADGTGGTWVHNTNDLAGGFKRVAVPPESYYVLGFAPENLKFDGSCHNLKVTLSKRVSGLTLQARRGYFAPKHEVNAAEEAKREIEESLFSRDEWHDIPVQLHTQFFKSSDVNAKLSVLARIDVRQLHFRKADGRNLDVLTVVSGIFDRNGNYISAVEKTVDMHLKDDTLAGKLSAGITVKSGFDVTPGSYFVRIVVRDAEGQKMAALNGAVEIP